MINRISGLFYLDGENIRFAALQKSFGRDFKIRNGVGSLLFVYNEKTVDALLDTLINNCQKLMMANVEKIIIDINIAYKGQANWSVSPEQMNKLSFLKAVLCVTAYEASEEYKNI